MTQPFRDKHLQFFYAYIMGALWEFGEVFSTGKVSVQIMHSKRIRVGLKKDCRPYVEKNMEDWLVTMGLEIRDEQTGKALTGGGSEVTTQASDISETWGVCQAIFLTHVPPYWKEEIVRTVLLTQGTVHPSVASGPRLGWSPDPRSRRN